MTAVSTSNTTGDACIDSLLGRTKWAASCLTYGFPHSAGAYSSSAYEAMTTSFGAFSTAQQSTARSALKLYSQVCSLTFQEVGAGATQQADLRFAKSDMSGTAWAYFPAADEMGGDVWFNKSSGRYEGPHKGNYAYLTFLHEIGHALGLEHAHESGTMPNGHDTMERTVMTYRSYAGASTTAGYMNETWGYAQSLMMYDIAALQHMYGANYGAQCGNTRYSWSPETGEMFINGVGQGAPGDNRIFLTVWDGGGSDTYDFSKFRTGVTVDLEPGAWTKTASSQLAGLHWNGSRVAAGNIANALLHENDTRSLVEKALGGSANDIIKGNVASNMLQGNAGNDKLYGKGGNDRLLGGAGEDRLYGQAGRDTLYGGSDADTFIFRSTHDSQGSAADTIRDFARGTDLIDLRGIDASSAKGGNQAFSFIGKSAFNGKAGQLKFSNGTLSGDIDGDRIADFQVEIAGLSVLSKGDFYL